MTNYIIKRKKNKKGGGGENNYKGKKEGRKESEKL